jgi:hypothetical protein
MLAHMPLGQHILIQAPVGTEQTMPGRWDQVGLEDLGGHQIGTPLPEKVEPVVARGNMLQARLTFRVTAQLFFKSFKWALVDRAGQVTVAKVGTAAQD